MADTLHVGQAQKEVKIYFNPSNGFACKRFA